jgi:hypothetical protein
MTHFVLQRCARLALYATLARCALACGADTDHGPPIGSPTGPVGPVVNEAGSTASNGQAGNQNAGGASPGTTPELGGAFDSAAGGATVFGFGGNGSAGRDPFGIGGSGPDNNPFGSGGSVSSFSSGGSPF